jgi:transposase
MTKTAHALQLIADGHKTPYVASHAGVTHGTVYDLRFRLNHPGYRRKSKASGPVVSRQSRADQACELAEHMPVAEVAEKMGLTERTVRQYVTPAREREMAANLPRCACGLLLPCSCGGIPRRAEDFLGRRGEQVINSMGR